MTERLDHGGRLDAAIAMHGGVRKDWLDLSTGISPFSYAIPELDQSIWSELPDDGAWDAAAMAARSYYGAPDEAHVSLAAGTQMHIQILPRLFKPQPVAVVGYTYQEHGVQWSRAGHDVFLTDGLESAEATARVVIVVNPNNPDGRIFDNSELLALSRRLAVKGGILLVDEAFADVAEQESLVGSTGRDGLLVLRSIGKFFGLAGARFGCAFGAEGLIDRIEASIGPWAISGPALAVATAALTDRSWQKSARKKVSKAREALEAILAEHELNIVGGTDLFVLAEHENAARIAQNLASHRILIRTFSGKPNWMRFGLPSKKGERTRLSKALVGALN